MRRRVTLKEVISIVKLSSFLIWGWPLPQNAAKLKIVCVKLYYCLNIILGICMAIPSIYCIRNHLDDPFVLLKESLLINNFIYFIFNFIFLIVYYHHIQNTTFEMVHFWDLMKPHEEVVIQRYIDKCVVSHGTFIFIQYFLAFTTIAVELSSLTHQPFQTLFEYPFDVTYQPLKTIIFMLESIVGLMLASQTCMTVYMVLLLWFASARFEILTKELRKVTDVRQLFKYIKKHQELLKYAREVTIAARPFAFINFSCTTFSLTGDLLFILLSTSHQSSGMISLSFFLSEVTDLLEVFLYAWPAEHLMYTSNDVAQAAFYILENKDLIEIWKYLQIIIIRSQKSITVSIPFFLPELSANYLTSYLSTILAYFTALRVIINKDNA